jgi:hypothetical protein
VGVAQNATLKWLRERAPGCRPLLVQQFPTFFVIHGYSAVSGRDLEALWPAVRGWAQDGSIDAVWLVQVWDLGTRTLLPHHEVPPGFTGRDVMPNGLSIGGTGLRLLALDRADAPIAQRCAIAPFAPAAPRR